MAVTVTQHYRARDNTMLVLKLACVAEADGSFTSYSIPETWHYTDKGFFCDLVTAVPGTTAPDVFDISLTDVLNINLLNNIGTNLGHPTLTLSASPSISGSRAFVYGALTIGATNQANASATWDVYLHFSRNNDFRPAVPSAYVTASITAQNTYTDAIMCKPSPFATGVLNLSISGISGSTVYVQRCLDGSNYRTVETYTADYEGYIEDQEEGALWRVGIPTGSFGSGTTIVRLSR